MKAVAKEIFLIVLLLAIIVFITGIIFYNYMPNNKVVPEPITYEADISTISVLQEIRSTSLEDKNSEEQSIIKSYSIGPKELSTAVAKQSYVSGKTNPFAEAIKPQNGNTNTSSTSTNTTSTNTTSTNLKAELNSTGTFFEKNNSK